MDNLRPHCAPIYKNGRLKTREEMDEDGTALAAFLELLADDIEKNPKKLKSLGVRQLRHLQDLVEGAEVDLGVELPNQAGN